MNALVTQLKNSKHGIDDNERPEILYHVCMLSTLDDKDFHKYWGTHLEDEWKQNHPSWHQYFVKNWLCDEWVSTWTYWGRQSLPEEIIATVRTNMLTERQWHYLKYTFFNRKVNHRYV